MNYKSFDDLSGDIRKNLHLIQEQGIELVVGIPRSGMVPAYMIGLHLNINVMDLSSFLNNDAPKKGITRKSKSSLECAHDAQKILLVDDSILSGNSMKEVLDSIPDNVKHKIITLAIYSSEESHEEVDMSFEKVLLPRVFEWNIFHRDLLHRACVDIDGVLCVDPTDEENDDGEKYIDFIRNVPPLFIPTYKIHSLVTSRLEKYREHTEYWLKKHGVEYDNLIMLDLPSKKERMQSGAHIPHKSSYYKKASDTLIFIESDINQALNIMKITGKPVYCVDENVMLNDESMLSFFRPQKYNVRSLKNRLKRNLPEPIKKILKPAYSFVMKK